MGAIREILRLTGGLCLISSHLTSQAHLSLTCSNALLRQAVAAALDCAEGWAALSIAAWMRLMDQGSPQSTGQPSVAHFKSIFAAGCLSTSLQGNIRPCILVENSLCVGVNGSGSALLRFGGAGRYIFSVTGGVNVCVTGDFCPFLPGLPTAFNVDRVCFGCLGYLVFRQMC